MGKCKFNENWLHNSNFAPWLRPVNGNVFEVQCILCKKKIKLGTMGMKALETHMQCEKHRAAAETCRKIPGISQFCSVTPTTVGLSPSAAASQTPASASASSSSTSPSFHSSRHQSIAWLHHNTQSRGTLVSAYDNEASVV